MPRVSLLMPVFNAAQYLGRCLESVQAQRFEDFELIVINDGSTDQSTDILRAFAQRELRMRLIERSNLGLIETRNQLLEEARGEFVAWMDSDDLSHADRLARQVEAFDRNPELVCVGTNTRMVDPDGLPLGFEEFPEDDAGIRSEQARGTGFRFPSTMQRRSVALAAGGFRQPFRIGEDLDFLLRVAEQGRLSNLPGYLYVYRQHLLNTCSAMGAFWPQYSAVILDLANERRETGSDKLQRGQKIDLPEFDPAEARKLLPIVLLNWAKGARDVGDDRRALRYILMAIRSAPLQRAAWRDLAKLVLQR